MIKLLLQWFLRRRVERVEVVDADPTTDWLVLEMTEPMSWDMIHRLEEHVLERTGMHALILQRARLVSVLRVHPHG
jgi:hypothetical protein